MRRTLQENHPYNSCLDSGCEYENSCFRIQERNLKHNAKNVGKSRRDFSCPIIVTDLCTPVEQVGRLVIRALQHDETAINELKERGLW